MKFITLYSFLLLFSNSLSGQNEYGISLIKKENYEIKNDSSYICITNNSLKTGNIFFDINDRFSYSSENIIEKIRKMPGEDPDYVKAWKYIIYNTFHSDTLTDKTWLHNPLILLNSVGYGFCDDRAAALSGIWRDMGYKTRVWNLEGHVVPEIYINGKYKMYDPDLEVSYTDEKSNVTGVEDIIKNPDSLIKAADKKMSLRSCINAYSMNMKLLYSTNNNKIDTFYDRMTDISNYNITMPQGSVLCLPVNLIIGPKNRLFYRHTAFFVIPEGFQGLLYFPFVISSVSGKGSLSYGEQRLSFNGIYTFTNTDFNKNIFITESGSPVVIEFYINPFMVSVSGYADIELYGDQKTKTNFSIEIKKDLTYNSRIIFWHGNDTVDCSCISQRSSEVKHYKVVSNESLMEKVKKYISISSCSDYTNEEELAVINSIKEIIRFANEIGEVRLLYTFSNDEPAFIYNIEKLRLNKDYLKVLREKFRIMAGNN